MQVLKIENLKKFYGTNTNITKAVNGISFAINEGEFVFLLAFQRLMCQQVVLLRLVIKR